MKAQLEHWCRQPALQVTLDDLQRYFRNRPEPGAAVMSLAEQLPPEPGDQARPAAVLILVTAEADGPHVTLTRRAEHLPTHAGQISFPGGAMDPGDADAGATALREAREEIGLQPDPVRILGRLGRYYTVTGYEVIPVLATCNEPQSGLGLRPDPGEVSEILNVPLAHLLNPANYEVGEAYYAGVLRHYYFCNWSGTRIWGATAGMLMGLYRELHAGRQ